MDLIYKKLDIRALSPKVATEKLVSFLNNRTEYELLWLIDNKEPIDCYAYLVQENYLFETFITSSKEYRVFVGWSYN
tara:strand:- start:1715 stop:1945 length:231 start_codon:yes stop_codon:yes gene_type:complete